MQRRLAAILAADVIGFSRLMAEDEAGTLTRLNSLHRELVQPNISRSKGRVVKLMGDGLLAEFPSVVDAVQCAVEMQKMLHIRETDSPEDSRIELRIGVNLGDIIVEGRDIFGDGVNIASRMEGLADSGGVCISGKVYEEIKNKLNLGFEDLGHKQVKNIPEPIRVYRWVRENPEVSSDASDSDFSPVLPNKPSIAVLPFNNMSGDPEQEYFSDGISEDIITELSHFREIAVVSRNSAFIFKGKSVTITEVSEKLNVQYVVEGSIRKAGNRVRVTVQLINANDDKHVWADKYDRELEDIFEVQDDVVHHIVSTLVGRLENEQQERSRRLSGNQLRSYDLYLQGREYFFNLTLEDNLKARDCLKTAIEIEPENAAALALSSEVLLRMWLNGWSNTLDEDLENSYDAARKAYELDGQDSRVHTALGLAYIFQRELPKAKHHFETALKLNPNDTRVLVYYSRHAVYDGNTEKALELSYQAISLNPFGKYNYNVAIACFAAHQYQEAISRLQNINNPPATLLALLAANYAMAGELPDAERTYAQFTDAAKSCPGLSALGTRAEWLNFVSSRWPFRKADDNAHVMEAFRRAGLPL
jgi:adenylate cyclase